jgi:hypothetical protein
MPFHVERYRQIQEAHMADVTDLKSYKFGKSVDIFMGAVGGIYGSEKALFETGKFLPFAEAYAESGFDEEYRPRFHVSIDFRDYKPSEDAQALLRRLKSDRFEIEKRRFARSYLAEVRKNGADPRDSFGPVASAEVSFEEARGVFAARDSGKLGAYQPSAGGFRTVCVKNWDDRGVGFNIVVCGNDHRRNRFEEHIIDDDADWQEIATMMAHISAARSKNDEVDIVPFRR